MGVISMQYWVVIIKKIFQCRPFINNCLIAMSLIKPRSYMQSSMSTNTGVHFPTAKSFF